VVVVKVILVSVCGKVYFFGRWWWWAVVVSDGGGK
jgi:hypothetical protein